MKITFIGAGNMTEAIVSGLLNKSSIAKENITVSDISEKRLDHMQAVYGVKAEADNIKAIQNSNTIVLAVKPQVFPGIWNDLKEQVDVRCLVISIMAGIPSNAITLGSNMRVVRVMPNTPALIGKGIAGVAPGEYANEDDTDFVLDLMEACGDAILVSEEQLHAVTALSGSGPAYIFYFIEAMAAAGKNLGLSKEHADILALATASGAAQMVIKENETPETLRERVTSKGGTTAAAIASLEEQQIKQAILTAMTAALHRSQELSSLK